VATNAEKRADIYFFLLLEHVEQKSTLVGLEFRIALMAILFVIEIGLSGVAFALLLKRPEFLASPFHFLLIISIGLFLAGGLGAFIMVLTISFRMRKLISSWESGVHTAIRDKLRKYSQPPTTI
jgi:hypothetical protein